MNAGVNAVAKRYKYTGKERDEETGLYYIGARYYCPWLARWCAADPINSEWYNLIKGTPQRNKERDVSEIMVSGYEYCYDNPVRFIDPSGENPKKQKVSTELSTESQQPIQEEKIVLKAPISEAWKPENTETTPERPSQVSPFVKKILDKIHLTEAGYVDRKTDSGGKTKYGIAETREWKAFAAFTGISSDVQNIQNITEKQVDKYYIHTRFERFRINVIKDEKIANAVFDQSVITPELVNRSVKQALNDLGYNTVVNNSNLNYREVKSLLQVDAEKFVEKFTSHQLEYYESLKDSKVEKTRENYKDHIGGWKNRLNALKNYKL